MSTNANRARHQFIVITITQVLGTAICSLIFLIGQVALFFIITMALADRIEDLYTVYFFLTFTIAFYQMNNVKSFYFTMLTSKTCRKAFIHFWKKLFLQLCYRFIQ